MTKPTLQTGDLWSETLANASIRPYVSPTNADEPGSMPPITDPQLDGSPEYIKARFYGWFDRVQLTASGGLGVSYSGALVRLKDGSIVTLSAGVIILPNNATNFVYINSLGSVAYATTLPFECQPLAKVTTVSGNVSQLIDLRYQAVEEIRPIALPPVASPFATGNLKMTLGNASEPGWLLCNGAAVSRSDYSALFAVIGETYGAGDGSLTFNLPDLRGRMPLGAGTGSGLSARSLGQSGGAESVQLTVAQLPLHKHGITDNGHAHPISDLGHNHAVNDPQHDHSYTDPGHKHLVNDLHRFVFDNIGISPDSPAGAEVSGVNNGTPLPQTDRQYIDIDIRKASTGITIRANNSNVSIQQSKTNIAIQDQGGNQPHENMPPFFVCNWLVKV